MPSLTRAPLTVVVLLSFAACKQEQKAPAAEAPSPPAAAPAPAAEPAAAEAAPAADPAVAAPATGALTMAALGKPARIDVVTMPPGGAGKTVAIDDAATIEAIVAAIGTGAATDVRRRCMDTIRLGFFDATGKATGSLGACNTAPLGDATPLEGLELADAGGGRGGFAPADEPALRKQILAALAR
jgi:hypothetical protein